jgi:isochorismate synthase
LTAGRQARWLLATPRTVLSADLEELLWCEPAPGQFVRLAEQAGQALRAAPTGQAVVGALPFDERTPSALALARIRTRHRTTNRPLSSGQLRISPPTGDASGYVRTVATAVRLLRAGAAHKVVLAHSLVLPGITPDDTPTLLGHLLRQHPTAYVFCVDIPGAPSANGPRQLLGASPELLVARAGDRLLLNPLAGSAPRHRDRKRDVTAARGLLASPKDRQEHALVVGELDRQLRPLCRELNVPRAPSLKAAGRLWHLSTVIHARLRHPPPTALELAATVHPTPAVCGAPRQAAQHLIQRLEDQPRDYYTGLVGWMDREGDGQWVIALRCGELSARGLRLYAGAGILPDSQPEAELAEVNAKFATMLDSVGADQCRIPRTRLPGPSGAGLV